MRTYFSLMIICIACLFSAGCDIKSNNNGQTIMKVDIESLPEESGLDEIETDKEVYFEGGESLKISTSKPFAIQLANTGDIDIENSILIYRAKIKTKDLDGKVYLEMWCSFKGKGQYFSKAIETALSGTNDWTVQETLFFLKKGENPDDIKLNLVVSGSGTVWIDQVELLKKPLK